MFAISKSVSKKVLPVLTLSFALALASCTKKEEAAPQADAAKQQAQTNPGSGNPPAIVTPPGGAMDLKIEDIKTGTGPEAQANKKVTVHYTGWLTNGTKFDSSVDRNQPFQFILNAGQVIQGWDKGVAGMKVGGKRKLTIPPQLGYGARGAGNVIPPDATLVFDVELLKVE